MWQTRQNKHSQFHWKLAKPLEGAVNKQFPQGVVYCGLGPILDWNPLGGDFCHFLHQNFDVLAWCFEFPALTVSKLMNATGFETYGGWLRNPISHQRDG